MKGQEISNSGRQGAGIYPDGIRKQPGGRHLAGKGVKIHVPVGNNDFHINEERFLAYRDMFRIPDGYSIKIVGCSIFEGRRIH